MIVRMSTFQKKASMTTAQFQSYWKEVHAPIALRIPKLLRYEQNHVSEPIAWRACAPAQGRPVDGICQLLFESESAMQGVLTPEMTRTLREDEARFIEGLQTFVIAQKQVIPGGDAPGRVKCISLVGRRLQVERAHFEREWAQAFADAMKCVPGIRGYTQNFVTDRTMARQAVRYEELPIDCIDEMWFDDLASLERLVAGQVQPQALAWVDALVGTMSSFVVRPYAPRPQHG